MNQEQLIQEMFEKGILISQELLKKMEAQPNSTPDSSLLQKLEVEGDLIVLNSDYADIVSQQTSLVDWYEMDRCKVEAEKERNEDLYQSQLQHFNRVNLSLNVSITSHSSIKSPIQNLNSTRESPNFKHNSTFEIKQSNIEVELKPGLQKEPQMDLKPISASMTLDTPVSLSLSTPETSLISTQYPVSIIISYENKPRKYEVKDFTSIFLSRYRFLEHLLRSRTEISENLITIGRLQGKKEREKVSIIGMVESSHTTKNGNLILTLEDLTGKINVLISKNNPDLLHEAKELVVDEVIGIAGSCGDKIIFAEKVLWPDIPAHNVLKKSEEDISAIFLADIHIGSKMFLKEEFEKFLAWLQGNAGSEAQQEAARKVKYIFIAGDLVDGIGIYPGQDEELEIKEIQQQYTAFTRLISLIPTDKQIIICPGNHDMIHLAEPQPTFYKQYAPELYTLPNVSLVTNPALVNIAKTATFPGFDVLLYHGYSFDYYVANVEAIRNQGGYNRADLLMKFLLKRRHLAPSFQSTPYFPAHAEDPLLIKKIPDFFLTGHIHYSKVANYKNITLIGGSCWQGKTAFQEKLGHQPEPARVPLVNLKTREVKVLKFI